MQRTGVWAKQNAQGNRAGEGWGWRRIDFGLASTELGGLTLGYTEDFGKNWERHGAAGQGRPGSQHRETKHSGQGGLQSPADTTKTHTSSWKKSQFPWYRLFRGSSAIRITMFEWQNLKGRKWKQSMQSNKYQYSSCYSDRVQEYQF